MADKRRRARRAAMAVAVTLGAGLFIAAVATPLASSPRELIFEIGPVDLPPDATHHDVIQPEVRAVTLPDDGWLQGYSFDLVDRDGRPIPNRVLHHLNLVAPERRELFSPIMLRLGAAGPETAPVKLPRLLGSPVRKGDTLVLAAMLHNPTHERYAGARIRVRMPYVPAASRVKPVSVYPFWVDVMPPAGKHDFDLPPGRSETYWEGSPALPGRILAAGGHMHRYALVLRFEDRTASRVIWEATAQTDSAGQVVGVPTKYFLWPPGATVDPSHVYRLSVVYDNPTGATIPEGGMGAFGGIFIPTGDRGWPEVVRSHPEYGEDVRVVWRIGREQAGSGTAATGHAGHDYEASRR